MIRRTLVLAGTSLLALVLMASAASAQYVDPGSGINVDDPSPSVGDTIVVSGSCSPNAAVTITLTQGGQTVVVGQTTANGAGQFSAGVTVPSNFAAGPATLSACGASINITLAGGAVGTLARTGSDSDLPMAKLAVVLVAAGGFLMLAARKRAARVTVDA